MHPALSGTTLVIYDLDGTLVDSLPDLAYALDRAFEQAGLPPPGETKAACWIGNGTRMLVRRALLDAGLALPEVEAMLERQLARFTTCYGERVCVNSRLYPGVRACLEAQKQRGIRQAIVTNKPGAFIAPILETFAIDGFFSLTLGGDALAEKKPHPAPLLHLCATLDVAPAQALMVGDSRNDVEAGKRAGIRTLAVPYGYNHGEPVEASQPDWMVESLDQLV